MPATQVRNYLADGEGNHKFYLEQLNRPYPDMPAIQPTRQGSVHTMMPSIDLTTGAPVAGQTIIQDFGSVIIGALVELRLPYITPAQRAAIEGLWYGSPPGPFQWSPNDGWTVYLVAWEPPSGYAPFPIPGFTDTAQGQSQLEGYGAALKFRIIQQLV